MSSPLLSCVIPCLDDPDIASTVRSLRETAPEVEIVVVNDSSGNWPTLEGCKVVHNRHRCGSGPSRHIGAIYATGEWLLHTDSHMRFEKGWYEAFVDRVKFGANKPSSYWTGVPIFEDAKPNTVLCGTMIALERDLSQHGEYSGATLNLVGPDPGKPEVQQVFQANWKKHANGEEIGMLMGACSFVSRDWYLSLSPHRHLRSYGFEEESMSLKTWLSGGRIEMLSGVRVGHIFRGKDDRGREIPQPYEVPAASLLYNKLFLMWTMLPFDLVERLLPKVEKTVPRQTYLSACEMIRQDWHLIAAERAESRFTMTFAEYCEKFRIPLP